MTSHEMRQADPIEHDRLMEVGARAGRACLNGRGHKSWARAFGNLHPSRASRHLSPDYPDGPQTQVLRTFHTLAADDALDPWPLLAECEVVIQQSAMRHVPIRQLEHRLAELEDRIDENDVEERKARRERRRSGEQVELQRWATVGIGLRSEEAAIIAELERRKRVGAS